MSTGVSFPLLEHPEIELPYLKGKIIPAICEYLAKIGGKIDLDNTMIWPQLQTNNVCLMDVAREMEITPTQLEHLNCVCKWFNVQYLSELCNKEGTMIRHGILNGSHFWQRYVRNFDGPKQKRPNSRSWQFWKKLLNTFIRNGTELVLKQRLGKWTKDHSKHGRWAIYT